MRKIFAIVLALVLALGLTVTASAADGVTVSDWAQSDVDAAVAAGIVPDTLPADYTKPITRAEFCAIAVRLYETLTGSEITGRTTFDDTSDADVEKMAYLGVVNGVGDGRFAPNDTLTREQAATILRRLVETMSEPLPEGVSDFADGDAISDWAFDAVDRMWAFGIMNGVSETEFDPQGSYTIEQSIVTMLRTKSVVENGAQPVVIANGSSGGNIRWSLDRTGKMTLSGTGVVKYNRDGIQPWTPVGDKITSIVVEEGVTNLSSAFENLGNLRSVTLSSSVTSFSSDLFNGCTSLVEINVAEGSATYCSVDGVLFSEDMTELIHYPADRTQTSYTVPDGVTDVEPLLNKSPYLTSLTLPVSLEYIAFDVLHNYTQLTDVYFKGSEAQFYAANVNGSLAWIPDTVTVHFAEILPTYTLTTVEDVYRMAEEVAARWDTGFRFDIAEDKYEEIVATLEKYLDDEWSTTGYRAWHSVPRNLRDGFDTVYVSFDYKVGLTLLPHNEGFAVGLSDEDAALLAGVEEILDEIITEGMSEYEKVRAIHDYIVTNTKYVSSAERSSSPCGPILDGQASCGGYSLALQVMCEMSGIDCLYVVNIKTMNHGWNKVKIDDVWYNVDATWDDPSNKDTLHHKYFLLSDDAFGEDHSWVDEWVPSSPVSHPEAEALRAEENGDTGNKKDETTDSTTTTANTETNTTTNTTSSGGAKAIDGNGNPVPDYSDGSLDAEMSEYYGVTFTNGVPSSDHLPDVGDYKAFDAYTDEYGLIWWVMRGWNSDCTVYGTWWEYLRPVERYVSNAEKAANAARDAELTEKYGLTFTDGVPTKDHLPELTMDRLMRFYTDEYGLKWYCNTDRDGNLHWRYEGPAD